MGISDGNLIGWIKVMGTRRLAEPGRFMRAVHWTTVALPPNGSVSRQHGGVEKIGFEWIPPTLVGIDRQN